LAAWPQSGCVLPDFRTVSPTRGRWKAFYVGPDRHRHTAGLTFSNQVRAQGWLANELGLIERGEWTPLAERRRQVEAAALIRGSQKAVFSSGSGGFSPPVGVPCAPESTLGQFFDLGPDPRETANLWLASSQIVHDMASDFTGATRFEWDATLPRRRGPRTSAPDADAPECGARARRFARISTAPAAASNGQNSGTSPHSTYVRAACQTAVDAGFSATEEADEIGETV